MRHKPLVLTIDAGSYLLVHSSVVETIRANVGAHNGFVEAGGILIGSYRGCHIEIVGCTIPQPQDVRRQSLFDRKDEGHQRAAMTAWHQSGETETYVGEWHTHPEDHPHSSSLDRHTWAGVLRKIPAPLIFCIAGWRSTWWGIGQGALVRELSREGAERPAG